MVCTDKITKKGTHEVFRKNCRKFFTRYTYDKPALRCPSLFKAEIAGIDED